MRPVPLVRKAPGHPAPRQGIGVRSHGESVEQHGAGDGRRGAGHVHRREKAGGGGARLAGGQVQGSLRALERPGGNLAPRRDTEVNQLKRCGAVVRAGAGHSAVQRTPAVRGRHGASAADSRLLRRVGVIKGVNSPHERQLAPRSGSKEGRLAEGSQRQSQVLGDKRDSHNQHSTLGQWQGHVTQQRVASWAVPSGVTRVRPGADPGKT
mmetsp:Transcript_8505/g.33625  ORF Transcript_8505/g.33625 Transcript_8505/m.33625 type:complete len:209 (-) Transcript_8505:1728-2354(-)